MVLSRAEGGDDVRVIVLSNNRLRLGSVFPWSVVVYVFVHYGCPFLCAKQCVVLSGSDEKPGWAVSAGLRPSRLICVEELCICVWDDEAL